jgi:hypothetical protein
MMRDEFEKQVEQMMSMVNFVFCQLLVLAVVVDMIELL